MPNKSKKNIPLSSWLFMPVFLLVFFAATDNRFYKRCICAGYVACGFALPQIAIWLPFKDVALAIIVVYFLSVLPFLYYGLLKDYLSPGPSKLLSILLGVVTFFAAFAATSGL